MQKTTVYLPEQLKRALRDLSEETGVSEAELVRQALTDLTRGARRRRPRGGLFHSGSADLSEKVDEALSGFGD